MKFAYSIVLTALFFVGVLAAPAAQAFGIVAVDESGKPAANVAFVLIPETPGPEHAVEPSSLEIKQKKFQFAPQLSTVSLGSTVSFPNLDTAHHHVYSFSEAKQFQFELFQGKSPSVTLEKPGVISLGCNIHDWMLSFIVVVDSPYHAVTNKNGAADFGNVPAGKYKISHWYPGMDERAGVQMMGNIDVKGDERGKLTIKRPRAFPWPKKPAYLNSEY